MDPNSYEFIYHSIVDSTIPALTSVVFGFSLLFGLAFCYVGLSKFVTMKNNGLAEEITAPFAYLFSGLLLIYNLTSIDVFSITLTSTPSEFTYSGKVETTYDMLYSTFISIMAFVGIVTINSGIMTWRHAGSHQNAQVNAWSKGFWKIMFGTIAVNFVFIHTVFNNTFGFGNG